jgi:hypothetical protein
MTDVEATTPGDPAMFAPLTAEENGILRATETGAAEAGNTAYPADSPVPYTLTAKAKRLLAMPEAPATDRLAPDAGAITVHDRQAESTLDGQPQSYITEISLPPTDSGIQRLHARMKEPESEPEAEL